MSALAPLAQVLEVTENSFLDIRTNTLGYFRKRVYLSCRPNQDIPFGQERVALQSGLNLPHRLLGE